jgi:hypothetical protein
MRVSSAIVVMFALVASASGAQALDMCFNTGLFPFQTIIVAKKYSKPSKGGCKPLTGFEGNANLGHRARLVSGTVCLNSAGDTLRVAYVVHPDRVDLTFEGTLWGQLDLVYPSLATGVSTEQQEASSPGDWSGYDGAFGGPCGFPQPIP